MPLPPNTRMMHYVAPKKEARLPHMYYGSSHSVSVWRGTVCISPGVYQCSWEDFRPLVEVHWGLGGEWEPEFTSVDGGLQAAETAFHNAIQFSRERPKSLTRGIRSLPPPYRPPVVRASQYSWVIYRGHKTGIFSKL